jgi:hypothetical protein
MSQRKTKYKSNIPETKVFSNGNIVFMDGLCGPRTPEEKMSYIYPQAEGIIRKFGGAGKLAKVLIAMNPEDPNFHWNRSSILRWTYPKAVGGTGGEIPTQALKTVVKAARFAGIVLTLEDLFPNLLPK